MISFSWAENYGLGDDDERVAPKIERRKDIEENMKRRRKRVFACYVDEVRA